MRSQLKNGEERSQIGDKMCPWVLRCWGECVDRQPQRTQEPTDRRMPRRALSESTAQAHRQDTKKGLRLLGNSYRTGDKFPIDRVTQREHYIRPWESDIVAGDDNTCVYLETSLNTSLHLSEREDMKPATTKTHKTGKGAITLKEIQTATENYMYLTRVKTVLRNGLWETFLDNINYLIPGDRQALARIWQVRDKLQTCVRGLIIKGKSIVMPKTLCGRTVGLAHRGHRRAAVM